MTSIGNYVPPSDITINRWGKMLLALFFQIMVLIEDMILDICKDIDLSITILSSYQYVRLSKKSRFRLPEGEAGLLARVLLDSATETSLSDGDPETITLINKIGQDVFSYKFKKMIFYTMV